MFGRIVPNLANAGQQRPDLPKSGPGWTSFARTWAKIRATLSKLGEGRPDLGLVWRTLADIGQRRAKLCPTWLDADQTQVIFFVAACRRGEFRTNPRRDAFGSDLGFGRPLSGDCPRRPALRTFRDGATHSLGEQWSAHLGATLRATLGSGCALPGDPRCTSLPSPKRAAVQIVSRTRVCWAHAEGQLWVFMERRSKWGVGT